MVNVNKHKDKANDTERNTAMRAKMKNNYKNINNWHDSCNQPTNQPTNLSYLNKKVVFAYAKTTSKIEYIRKPRLLLFGT